LNGTAAATSIPSTWYVDAAGNGNYTTIQAAINHAGSGDTILVYPGTYTENVNVTVANVRILSYSGNPEDTIVKRLNILSHNFKISANNVTISGFNITGAGSTGIYMSGVSGANITNNKLSGIGCGVQMESSSGCNLINNTVIGSAQYGFYLDSSSNCTIAENTISDTVEEGILLEYSNYCALANNTISNSYDEGIYLYYSVNCNLTGNAVSGTNNGIDLSFSSNCNITGNTVSNTEDDGIDLDSSSNCNLTGNTVSNSMDDGIDLNSSSNCNLTGNTVSNTMNDSIYLEYAESCSLTGNAVSDSYCSGISLNMSESCILTNNTASNVDYEGIYLWESGNCVLVGNAVEHSDGIYLEDSDECVLRNNTASSGIYGIGLDDSENCTLTGNIMSENRYNFDIYCSDFDNATGNIIDTSNLVDGKTVYYLEREQNPSIGRDAGVIYCINCGNVEIKDLVLQNNSYAVFLYNTSSEIQNITINNTIYGVTVLRSQDIMLSGNTVENSMCAVVLEEAMNATFADNIIRNSIFGIENFVSENSTFTNTSIEGSSFVGIATIGSRNCTLADNSIESSLYGLLISESENCTFTSNFVKGSIENDGLFSSRMNLFRDEENTLIRENSIINSNLVQVPDYYGYGIYSSDSQNLSFEDNIIDQAGLSGIYLTGCQNSRIVSNSVRDIGYVGIYTQNSSSIELLDNTVQNVTGDYTLPGTENFQLASSPFVDSSLVSVSRTSGYGIYSDESSDIRLEGNTVKNCYPVWGMYLSESVNATVESNTLQNCQGGLITVLSENFSISNCSVTNCTSGGILVINPVEGVGNGYTVSGCTVRESEVGLLVTGEGTLSGNTLSGNLYGLILYDVNNSLICGNTMAQNSVVGLALDLNPSNITSRIGLVRSMESPASSDNMIYNNYFNNVNNTLFYSDANNTWNTSKTAGRSIVSGPYLGGNYWANPNGTGFSQNCTDTNRDGIADSAYEIKNGTYDNLPLTIIPSTTHRSSASYVPSGGSSGVTGIDSAQKTGCCWISNNLQLQ